MKRQTSANCWFTIFCPTVIFKIQADRACWQWQAGVHQGDEGAIHGSGVRRPDDLCRRVSCGLAAGAATRPLRPNLQLSAFHCSVDVPLHQPLGGGGRRQQSFGRQRRVLRLPPTAHSLRSVSAVHAARPPSRQQALSPGPHQPGSACPPRQLVPPSSPFFTLRAEGSFTAQTVAPSFQPFATSHDPRLGNYYLPLGLNLRHHLL